MHQLINLARQVNQTHPRLGPAVAFTLLCAKARKCVLNISPAGCGKSAASEAVAHIYTPQVRTYDSVTRGALRFIDNELSNYWGLVIIDDLGKVDTTYSRMATITTFAELCYSHFVRKLTMTLNIAVNDFHGAAILNIQPVLMVGIMQSDEWEAVIRDKTVRYYHLFRPLKPKRNPPRVQFDLGLPMEDVKTPKGRGALWYKMVRIGLVQWSYARVLEHCTDLLRAAAAIDGRRRVNASDYYTCIKLMKPMMLERFLMEKYAFEAGRVFQHNAFCILTELATHSDLTLDTVCVDYKVSPSTAERLIGTVSDWAFVLTNSPKRVMPTEYAKKVLRLVGVYDRW